MFITDNNHIEIQIYYKKSKNKYVAYSGDDFKKMCDEKGLSEEDKAKYKVLNIKMRQLTWGLYNDIQEDAMEEDTTGARHFNFKKYKENRLFKLLHSWDAKDEKEKTITINAATLKSLSPHIAEVILATYDKISILDEEEEKN